MSERFGKVLQQRQSMTINRNDKSTSISTQMDSLIPQSKISTLTQGIFVGAVSDNFEERIEQKIFHCEIVVDNERVAAEAKSYRQIAERDHYVTAEKVKNAFLGLEVRHETLLKLYAQHNEEFAGQVGQMRSASTYEKYRAVYKHLEDFLSIRYRVKDIALKELTSSFITEFELFLRTHKGCAHNTIWLYVMPLRRMVTIAGSVGLRV